MPQATPNATDSNARKAVYVVVDTDGGKARWIRVGIAFPCRDGSLNVSLDALPVNGRLHIRDFPPREEGAPEHE